MNTTKTTRHMKRVTANAKSALASRINESLSADAPHRATDEVVEHLLTSHELPVKVTDTPISDEDILEAITACGYAIARDEEE